MASRDYYFQILVVNRQGYINELEDIFAKHLDVHEIDATNHTNFLHTALQNATQTTPPIETIQFYLVHRLDVNLQDAVGNTPLHYAMLKSNVDCALLLLQHGANPNLANAQHITALGMLHEINHTEKRLQVLAAMLEQGGDASLPNGTSTIFDNCVLRSQTDPSFEPVVALIEQYWLEHPIETKIQASTATIQQEIAYLVRENILLSSQIISHIMAVFELPPESLADVQQWVKEHKLAFNHEQTTWPSTTDCEKLVLVFYALFKQNIIALPNAGDSLEQAHAAVSQFQQHYQGKQVFQAYCFFSRNHIRHAIDEQTLSLVFGTLQTPTHNTLKLIGKLIIDKLKEQGLQASWDGNADSPIYIHHFTWCNRTDFDAFINKYLL